MDVGINPAHVVHRAVLKAAEGIAIVIKPEIPDLAETRRWIARMINSLASVVGKGGAHEFVGSRVKLCYNQVVGDGFKSAHKMLQQALSEDKIELALIPNGILPIVDPRLAAQAVNSALLPILCPPFGKVHPVLDYCPILKRNVAGSGNRRCLISLAKH